MNFPNQQQWAIILETISFGLVTLDLYGESRLIELRDSIQKLLYKIVNNVRRTSPFSSISKKNNFITTSLLTLWKALLSFPVVIYNLFREIFKLKPKDYDKLTEQEINSLSKFINILFIVLILTLIITILLLIFLFPHIPFYSIFNISIYFYGLTFFCFLIISFIKFITKGKHDFSNIIKTIALIPVYILIALISIFYLVIFISYFYAIPYLLTLPLFIVLSILKFGLKVISEFQLKNIMLFLGSLLFLISKYLSYISS